MPKIVPKERMSIPRGDERTFPFALDPTFYESGCRIFFAVKATIDDDPNDTEALIRKVFTDGDIVSVDDDGVHYSLAFVEADTFDIAPGTYLAEFQFVRADGTGATTFPDPEEKQLLFTVGPDVNRRTT